MSASRDIPAETAGLDTVSPSKSSESDQMDLEAEKLGAPAYNQDAFGNEEFAEVKYKVLR